MALLDPRPTWRDGVPIVFAVLFGAVSFFYPYGRDQGLFHYVGSEWLSHHGIPYRDLVEHKPPGIFIVFGVLARIFGDAQWPIRVVDMGFLFAAAIASALLAVPRGVRPSARVLSLTIAVASVLYYGFLNFWDTAQCDFTYVVLAVVALAVLHRDSRWQRAQIVAGLLFGAALIVKPLAGPFGLIALASVVRDARLRNGTKAALVDAVRLGAATAAIPVLTLVYFAAHGALGDFVLWVGKVNGYYARHETTVHGFGEFASFSRYALSTFGPMAVVLIALLAQKRATTPDDERTRHEWRTFAALFAAGTVAVLAQMKFFRYHFAALFPSFFVAAAALIGALEARYREKVTLQVLAATCVLFLLAEPAATQDNWWHANAAVIRHLRGTISDEEFERTFVVPSLGYDYADVAATGRWLRAHTQPGEPIVARGFEPVIYEVAHRRYTGRFFWSNFITDSRRSLLHEQWLAEETANFERTKPRYAVAIAEKGEIDGADWYEARGYRQVAQFGLYRIMERQ